MPEYRLHFLDPKDRIMKAMGLTCPDDAAAIAAARTYADADVLELWRGSQLVARLEPERR